jgi:hypothetical protein
LACYMYILTDESPCWRSWKESWSCMMRELDGDARAFSRVRQTHCEVWQSTTRCNTSIKRERGEKYTQNKLILLLPTKKRRADLEEEPVELSEIWDGGHNTEPSTKWKTTLTKEIGLHLNSPIEIICVHKFPWNNLVGVW